MPLKVRDDRQGFGLVSILLHWSIAIATLGLFASGLWMTGLDYYDNWYHRAPALHKSVGMMVLFVAISALCWRLLVRRPAPLSHIPVWQQVLARTVHGLICVLLLVVLASGYLISAADGNGVAVFDWLTAPSVGDLDNEQVEWAGRVHLFLAWALIGLAAAHAAAALKHHFLDRDTTLRRMINPNL